MSARTKQSPVSQNIHLVERSPESTNMNQQQQLRSNSQTRSSSGSCRYEAKDVKAKAEFDRNKKFRAKLLEIQLEQQKDLRPLEKQMTAREKEAYRRQQDDKSFMLEEKNATYHPQTTQSTYITDTYQKQHQKLVKSNRIAERFALKRSQDINSTDEQIIQQVKQDIKDGKPYEFCHGYDYKVLRKAGLLDSSSSAGLSKTGYAAVSQVYDQAQRRKWPLHMDTDFNKVFELECVALEQLPEPLYPINLLVNIYDLDEKYKWTKNIGMGIFHTAIEIGEKEIAYGGHSYEGTGIFFAQPLTMEHPATFYKQMYMGTTSKSYSEIAQVLRSMRDDWLGSNYNLLKHNCNHFTEELLIRLCGHASLPNFVNRAACVADALGCGPCIARNGSKGQLNMKEGPKVKRR